MFFLLIGLIVLCTRVRGFALEDPVAWGSCEQYTGSACESDSLGSVWIFDGSLQIKREMEMMQMVILLNTVASIVGDSKCTALWKQLYCSVYFPPCVEVNGVQVPQKICVDKCTELHEVCAAGFSNVAKVGYAGNILQCDDNIGDPARIANYLYPLYLEQWQDTPVFVEESSPLVTSTNQNVDVPCYGGAEVSCRRKECPPPYFELSMPKNSSVDASLCSNYSETLIDCELCVSECQSPCPVFLFDNPILSDKFGVSVDDWSGTWNQLWISRWLPSILALPLNALVIFSEAKKLKKTKKRRSTGNVWLMITAVTGFLFAFFDGVPIMILKFDMQCDGLTYFVDARLGGHWICSLSRYCPHISQMMLGAVGVTLIELWRKLNAACNMKGYKQSAESKIVSAIYIFILPFVLFLVNVSTPLSDGERNDHVVDNTTGYKYVPKYTDMTWGNRVRYAFSCGPRLGDLDMEYALVVMPSIVYGTVSLIASGLLLRVIVTMIKKSSTGGKSSANKTQVALGKTMIKFAVVCFLLLMLNVSSLLPFMSKAMTFSEEMSTWTSCAASGVNLKECKATNIEDCEREVDIGNLTKTIARCGVLEDIAPSPTLLLGMMFAYSMPSFCFGLLFSWQALKHLLRTMSAHVSPSKTSSQASSSSAN